MTYTAPTIIISLSALFAIVLLSQKRSKLKANKFLAVFLLATTIQFLLIVLTGIAVVPQQWVNYNTVFGYLYGPSVYYYIILLIDSKYRFTYKDFAHYLSAFLVFLCLLYLPKSTRFLAILMYISLTTYVIISFRLLREFKRKLKAGRWKKPNNTLQWLRYFLALFTILLFLDLIDQTIFYLYSFNGFSIVHFGLILLICWMFFRAFNQPELFKDNTALFKRTKVLSWEFRNNDQEKQDKTLILEDNIKKHLSKNKWFLLPNLTLEELANKLETTPQILSATINSSYGLNFSSLINSLRIEYAKELLSNFNKSEKSISEIMYDCGFVSKSSFNTIFKSKTGVTPSQFRELKR